MEESSSNVWKTLWEKEKLLVTSNFSFSHSVFKSLVMQTRKNQGLFGKGLKAVISVKDTMSWVDKSFREIPLLHSSQLIHCLLFTKLYWNSRILELWTKIYRTRQTGKWLKHFEEWKIFVDSLPTHKNLDTSKLEASADWQINPLPNGKFLDRSTFKAFANDKIDVT